MRNIIRATQKVLSLVAESGAFDPALFEPSVTLEGNPVDSWYALQLDHFWRDLGPATDKYWREEAAKSADGNLSRSFPYSEQEVMWAFTKFSDSYGAVLKR